MLQRQEWGGGLQTGLVVVEISMKHWDVFWHARLVGAGPDLWGKKLCLAALIAAVGGVHQKFASEHTFTENNHNNQDTSLTTARNHRVESAALQMQSPSEC